MARILITGSTTGLGLIAARSLADRGHQVTLHARDRDRAGDVRRELATGTLSEAPVVVGDLSRIAGVRSVATQANDLGRYDAVIHNAGVYRVPNRVGTDDGLSLTFAVNVLAPYLLSALLHRPDRIVLTTSGLQSGGSPDLADAQWVRRRWDWMQAYADSKLFDTMLAFGLARRWPRVRANAVDPGWVPTRMGGAGAPDDLALGADSQAWLAAGEDPAADVTARVFHHRREQSVPAAVRRETTQEALFAYCSELTGDDLGGLRPG